MAEFEKSKALDWDTEIILTPERVTFDAGTYDFIVIDFARERFDGDEKYNACPVAKLTLKVRNPQTEEETVVYDRIRMTEKMKWKLEQFGRSIGCVDDGKLRIPWERVCGMYGKVSLSVREYTYQGEERTTNDVERYIAKKAQKPTPTQSDWSM